VGGTTRIDSSGNGTFSALTATGTTSLSNIVNIGTATSGNVVTVGQATDGQITLGSGSIQAQHTPVASSWYQASVARAFVSGSGIFYSYDNSSNIRASMTNSGFDTTQGYAANGTAGISTTITVRNSAGTGTCTITFSMGLATATTC
jgi:hypothetical protein